MTYLISREYEGLVSYLLLFYHRSCLVSMCLSTELWTLSHQSCIANIQSKETECHSSLNSTKFQISLRNKALKYVMKHNRQALLNLQKIKLGGTASLTTKYVRRLNIKATNAINGLTIIFSELPS